MIGWNIAPGLRRSFPSEAWGNIPRKLWDKARDEAFDAVKDDVPLNIIGSDIDPAAIEVAEAAAKAAGLDEAVPASGGASRQGAPARRLRLLDHQPALWRAAW